MQPAGEKVFEIVGFLVRKIQNQNQSQIQYIQNYNSEQIVLNNSIFARLGKRGTGHDSRSSVGLVGVLFTHIHIIQQGAFEINSLPVLQ